MVSGLLGNRHVLILNCDSQSIRSENCSVTRSLLFIYLSNPLRGMLPVVHLLFLMSRKLILYQIRSKEERGTCKSGNLGSLIRTGRHTYTPYLRSNCFFSLVSIVFFLGCRNFFHYLKGNCEIILSNSMCPLQRFIICNFPNAVVWEYSQLCRFGLVMPYQYAEVKT